MFTPEKWPLIVVSIGMIVGAVIDGWKFKVPNRLTFPLIITGWLLGAYYDFAGVPTYTLEGWRATIPEDTSWRFTASLFLTLVAFFLLGPVMMINYMGAGDVKLLMGLGAWVGAFYGRTHGFWFFFYAYATGVILGGIFAILMMIPNYKKHIANMRVIMQDWATGSLQHISDRAAERKKFDLKLPYGVPITIGMLAYFWLLEYQLVPLFLNPYPPQGP